MSNTGAIPAYRLFLYCSSIAPALQRYWALDSLDLPGKGVSLCTGLRYVGCPSGANAPEFALATGQRLSYSPTWIPSVAMGLWRSYFNPSSV